MAGTRDARARLLGATVQLLREGGLDAASPAAVAERAGAGKMSLYRHFSGKDELIGAALIAADAAQRDRLIGDEPDPRDRLLGMFDRALERAGRPGFSGCPYVATCLEAHDPAHPASAAAREHKAAMRATLEAAAAQLDAPPGTARALQLLFDGALVHAVIEGTPEALRDGRAAAAALLPR